MDFLPSGLTVVWNKTKKPTLWRPQVPLTALREAAPAICTMCLEADDPKLHIRTFADEGWRLKGNRDPNHPYSRLVLPISCRGWSSGGIRRLGGCQEIGKALGIIDYTLSAEAPGTVNKQVLCHVGYSAGQNYYHPHWHVILPQIDDSAQIARTTEWLSKPSDDHPTLEIGGRKIILAGSRPGRCWILPEENQAGEQVCSVAGIIDKIIGLFCYKLESLQGEAPDYNILIRVDSSNKLQYASVTPILNNWGANDGAGVDEGAQLTAFCSQNAMLELLL